MDEKGFLQGLGARTKIVFNKEMARKELIQGYNPDLDIVTL